MFALWFVIIIEVLLINHCHGVGTSVTEYSFTTDTENAGDASIKLTLIWNDKEYSCTLNPPHTTSTTYSCNSANWVESSITPITSNPYSLKIAYSSSNPVQITELKITDNNSDYYTIDRFCIASKMTCTINQVIFDEYTSSNCDQWSSKLKYNVMALGGDTDFKILHVDIPIFGTRFANMTIEGGIRPPNLIKTGFFTGNVPPPSVTAKVSIQWDTVLYSASILADSAITLYEESVSATTYCPGIPSDFWISIYNNDNGDPALHIRDLIVHDEANNTYMFFDYCWEDGPATTVLGNDGPCIDFDLSQLGYLVPKDGEIVIGSSFSSFPDLVPFFMPDCLFEVPNMEVIAVSAGMSSIMYIHIYVLSEVYNPCTAIVMI